MDIISEDDIDNVQAKKIMDERKKGKELGYEQRICYDYLEKVVKLSDKKHATLVEELSKMPVLKSRYIALIINTMPDTEEEVDAIFSKERTNLKKNEIKQIIEIVKKVK